MVVQTPLLTVPISILVRQSLNSLISPSSSTARSYLFSDIYVLAKQTTLSYCNIVQSMLLPNLINCRSFISKSILPSKSNFILLVLNSTLFLYKITFTYVTFAVLWNGRFYVIAVDYDRYVIFKHCPFNSTQRKYVPCECVITN